MSNRRTRYKKLVHVRVGRQQELFVVHLDPICERSAFFKAKCSETWSTSRASRRSNLKELQRKQVKKNRAKAAGISNQEEDDGAVAEVNLPDEDPGTFSLYIDSVYSNSRDLTAPAQELEEDVDMEDDVSEEWDVDLTIGGEDAKVTRKRKTCLNLCRL
jgi:hypothetical protein